MANYFVHYDNIDNFYGEDDDATEDDDDLLFFGRRSPPFPPPLSPRHPRFDRSRSPSLPVPLQQPVPLALPPPFHPPRSPVPVPEFIITKQPPEQWYQRGTNQEFSIETRSSFTEYTLELVFAPDVGGSEYEPVSITRKVGNGFKTNTRSRDTRDSNVQLTVRPKIDICTRKGERLFVLQLTLSSGLIIRSIPFHVKNRQPNPTTFKSDANRVLRQLEWCDKTQTCHICHHSITTGHMDTCTLRSLLYGPART